jgi:hypothetical protein
MTKYEEVNPFMKSNLKPRKLSNSEVDIEDANLVEAMNLSHEIEEVFIKHGTTVEIAYTVVSSMTFMIQQYLNKV